MAPSKHFKRTEPIWDRRRKWPGWRDRSRRLVHGILSTTVPVANPVLDVVQFAVRQNRARNALLDPRLAHKLVVDWRLVARQSRYNLGLRVDRISRQYHFFARLRFSRTGRNRRVQRDKCLIDRRCRQYVCRRGIIVIQSLASPFDVILYWLAVHQPRIYPGKYLLNALSGCPSCL